MAHRTFVVGDIHGDLDAVFAVFKKLPQLDAKDTVVFLGDYVDRGPDSKGVVDFVRTDFQKSAPCKVVALRGNHEDGWLHVVSGGWPEFIVPPQNGCLATYLSFKGLPVGTRDIPEPEELLELSMGEFFPGPVVEWMMGLPYFYEDDHAIYVHAGLVENDRGEFVHPMEAKNPRALLWLRTPKFFSSYQGKRVVVGHTCTDHLPPDLSSFTPADPADAWMRDPVFAIDTGAGKGGFLTVLELPSLTVYESR